MKDPENHNPKYRVVFKDEKGRKRTEETQAVDEFKAYEWAGENRQNGEKVDSVKQITSPCRLYNLDREMFVKRNRYFDLWFDTPNDALKYIRLYNLDPQNFVVA